MTALATRDNHVFFTLPNSERTQLKATEQRLISVYEAAYKGLKGDSLALASGMLPIEFNRLRQMDPLVDMAVLKGRADSELEMANHLMQAARNGDAKAALDILKHSHAWTAATQVNVTVQGQISITDALAAAEKRVQSLPTIEADYAEIPPPEGIKLPKLTPTSKKTTEKTKEKAAK
tara:strand:+ start:117 stop:647 length:531 start_codon:yes stop_codon:yes gene_type:complete